MASRRDRHQAHQAALSALGKNLSRRARSRCELCEASGVPLQVTEVPGAPDDEVDEEWALLLCEPCRPLAEGRTKTDHDSLRFLAQAMWSETQPVQVVAVRALRTLDEPWATEALDSLWLDDEREALIGG